MRIRKATSDSLLLLAFLLFTALCGGGCRSSHKGADTDSIQDLQAIKSKGELVVLTLYGPTSYFNYRDEMMGFQYELSRQFAKFLGVKLTVKVAPNIQELRRMLLAGEGNLIAYTLPINKIKQDSLLYCGEEIITHQVLVQRKGGKALTDVTQLIGKEIYAKPGKFVQRLKNLDKELGGGICIHEVNDDNVSAEDLILKVSEDSIAYTVCENDLALLNSTYYNNLDVSLAISFDQRSSWAVRKDEPQLARTADKWYRENVKSEEYMESARRYFEQNKVILASNVMLNPKTGKISIYDHLFKKYAKEMNLDWRLLASIAYQESNFNPNVVSWAGAKGLMQLMPRTARIVGIPPGKEANPAESIKGAIKYLDLMNKNFNDVASLRERTNFVLAAYNAGVGHVRDAMALAKKYGHDKTVWHNSVEHFILLKSNEEYYTDPVCKNGYFRGRETYDFVRQVKSRFEFYKRHVKR